MFTMFDNKRDSYWDKIKQQGKVTKVIDIPFADFGSDTDILKFADTVINRSGLFDTGDPYWKVASRAYLFDILSYIKKTRLSAEQNIESVVKLLKMDKESLKVLIDNFHKNYGIENRHVVFHDVNMVHEAVSGMLLQMFE